jgi:hypothetical protein
MTLPEMILLPITEIKGRHDLNGLNILIKGKQFLLIVIL